MIEDEVQGLSEDLIETVSNDIVSSSDKDSEVFLSSAESVEPEKSPNSNYDLESEFKKIPDQMAFKIGDVADLVQVKPYVLRYWEQEFKSLNPKKAVNNQRIYSRRDVETVILIKKFLYVDQFSIPGARKALKDYREIQAKLNAASKEKQIQLDSNLTIPPGFPGNAVFANASNVSESAELLTEKYIKIEDSISKLISKIRSVRGKLEHKFHQIGL